MADRVSEIAKAVENWCIWCCPVEARTPCPDIERVRPSIQRRSPSSTLASSIVPYFLAQTFGPERELDLRLVLFLVPKRNVRHAADGAVVAVSDARCSRDDNYIGGVLKAGPHDSKYLDFFVSVGFLF